MDSEVFAALLGALVGGLTSGVAALGGSVMVEKMKLHKGTRIHMYKDLLPPIRNAAYEYRYQVVEGEAPEPLPQLLQNLSRLVADLDHISAMAGWHDRRLVRRIVAGVREHSEQASPNNWEDTIAGGKRWLGDRRQYRAVLEAIYRDVGALESWLRKKVN